MQIAKDGIYRVGDKVTGSQIQYVKGTEIGDMEVEYVGPFPDPQVDVVAERNAKAEAAPENKAAPAPTATKADKG